jgi:hypothetical protein
MRVKRTSENIYAASTPVDPQYNESHFFFNAPVVAASPSNDLNNSRVINHKETGSLNAGHLGVHRLAIPYFASSI